MNLSILILVYEHPLWGTGFRAIIGIPNLKIKYGKCDKTIAQFTNAVYTVIISNNGEEVSHPYLGMKN